MEITLPYPPTTNHLYTIARGRKILSTKGRDYKAEVAKLCQIARIRPLEGNVSVSFTAYRPRKSGDLDNLQKSVFDSLKGYAWHDDKQIIEIHAYRDDDKLNPRVVVTVTNV